MLLGPVCCTGTVSAILWLLYYCGAIVRLAKCEAGLAKQSFLLRRKFSLFSLSKLGTLPFLQKENYRKKERGKSAKKKMIKKKVSTGSGGGWGEESTYLRLRLVNSGWQFFGNIVMASLVQCSMYIFFIHCGN